jgi:alkylglycerol monooxygenase
MEYSYAAFAIPAFFLFLGLELVLAKKKNRQDVFKYESSVANLSIGIAERLLNLFISASFYQLFCFIYDNYRVFTISSHWSVWVLLLLSTDLVWYWYHRLGHEVNLLWGAHIVHHQSEEFNYTVSARITTIQAIVRNLFWCILPFAGFQPLMVMTILIVHGAYSFFTHTQLVRLPGWLEHVFVTPSIHGVHHASNEKYLNKNYGDLFVFWDKLFGTFVREDEQPVYGLTHPLNSYSFMWQHFHYYMEMAEACRRNPGLRNKLRIIFGDPALLDQDIRPMLEEKFLPHKRLAKPKATFRIYVNVQLVVVVLLLMTVTYFFGTLDPVSKVFGTAFVMITLINCGALLEQRKWIYYLEICRILLLGAFLGIALETYHVFTAAVLVSGLLVMISNVRHWYLRKLYETEL